MNGHGFGLCLATSCCYRDGHCCADLPSLNWYGRCFSVDSQHGHLNDEKTMIRHAQGPTSVPMDIASVVQGCRCKWKDRSSISTVAHSVHPQWLCLVNINTPRGVQETTWGGRKLVATVAQVRLHLARASVPHQHT